MIGGGARFLGGFKKRQKEEWREIYNGQATIGLLKHACAKEEFD